MIRDGSQREAAFVFATIGSMARSATVNGASLPISISERQKTKMNQSLFQYPYQYLPYECLVENHIDHLLSEYARLSTDAAPPQLWSVTTTFVPFEKKQKRVNAAPSNATRYDQTPMPPRRWLQRENILRLLRDQGLLLDSFAAIG